MQKVLRRTELAKGQAARKAAQRKKINDINLYRYAKRLQKPLNQETRAAVHNARKTQREDWTLGALAPKRDIAGQVYGTVSVRRIQPPAKMGNGRWKDYCIVEGDRVVIVEPGHRDRGKIGTVKELHAQAEHCVVTGINEMDVAVPEYMLINESDKTLFRTVEGPIPLSSVNLVYPLPNPTTGELRDVIIKQLRKGQVRKSRKEPRRYIADYEPAFNIPFPEKETPEYKDHDSDTFRIEVEKKTWTPTLIRPPMPPSIIDELRNKYSKFRDRHDEDFVRKKAEVDEAVVRKKREMKQLMTTPASALYTRERRKKRARGKRQTLDDGVLSIIGQHMAKRHGANSTAPRLGSSAPSPAASHAMVSKSSKVVSYTARTPLGMRSFHSLSRAYPHVGHIPSKRGLSTVSDSTPRPTGSNPISVREVVAPAPTPATTSTPTHTPTLDQWTVPLSNNLIQELSQSGASTTSKFGWLLSGSGDGTPHSIRKSAASSRYYDAPLYRSFPAQRADPDARPLIRRYESGKTTIRRVDLPLDRKSLNEQATMLRKVRRQETLARAAAGHVGKVMRRVTSESDFSQLAPVQKAQTLHVCHQRDARDQKEKGFSR